VALIGRALLELIYPLALELVLHSAIVTDFTMERLPDSPLDVLNSVHATKSVTNRRICFKEKQSHRRSVLPRERTGIPHLPATPTEWWLSSEGKAFIALLSQRALTPFV
jgi:hypothetical protein